MQAPLVELRYLPLGQAGALEQTIPVVQDPDKEPPFGQVAFALLDALPPLDVLQLKPGK